MASSMAMAVACQVSARLDGVAGVQIGDVAAIQGGVRGWWLGTDGEEWRWGLGSFPCAGALLLGAK